MNTEEREILLLEKGGKQKSGNKGEYFKLVTEYLNRS